MRLLLRRARAENGSSLIVTLIVLLGLTVIATGTVFMTGLHSEISASAKTGHQALYFAEAGVNWGLGWAKENRAQATTGDFETTQVLSDASGNPIQIMGAGGTVTTATANITVGPSFDSRGRAVQCGLIGFSEKYGSPRFRVDSTGNGPGGARRAIEAHVFLPPQEGLCPPGTMVAGGYAGGG